MRRILVVDDEVLISMMVQAWLAELGYETVGPARSVAGALRLIDSFPPDAAFLDLALADGQSYPVADVLRDRGIPFAFVTGHGASGIAARFKGTPVLPKPFDFTDVEATMKALLNTASGLAAPAADPVVRGPL